MALTEPILPPAPWARGLAAALTAALVAAALVAGHGALLGDRMAHARRVGAAALADGVAQAATERDQAKRDTRLKELENARKPDVERVFVLQEGGTDEFGISRGTVFSYGEPPKDQAQLVQDHAKTVTAEATRVLLAQTAKPGEQLHADRMFKVIDGDRLVVAAPIRSAKASKELSGVGGAIVALLAGGRGGAAGGGLGRSCPAPGAKKTLERRGDPAAAGAGRLAAAARPACRAARGD
jgi:hypothetical protein